MPDVGARYRYAASAPLGHAARVADPDTDETAPTEEERRFGVEGYAPGGADHPDGPRAALDMHPDTLVTVCGHDDDRDLVLVEWTDSQGNPRITSIAPDVFDDQFTEEG